MVNYYSKEALRLLIHMQNYPVYKNLLNSYIHFMILLQEPYTPHSHSRSKSNHNITNLSYKVQNHQVLRDLQNLSLCFRAKDIIKFTFRSR